MIRDFQFAARAEVFRHELYRNPNKSEFEVDWWGHDTPSWGNALLLKFGDLLISVGTRLKHYARPRAVFSEEML